MTELSNNTALHGVAITLQDRFVIMRGNQSNSEMIPVKITFKCLFLSIDQ